MRLALLVSTAMFGAALATFACSSSNTSTPVEEPDAGAPTRPEENETPEEENNETPAPIEEEDAGGGADATADTEPPVVGDGDAGTVCNGDSVRETEANNDVASADALPVKTHTFCGRVLKGGDVDVFAFTMPNQVGNFGFSLEQFTGGGLKIEPSADGVPFDFNGSYPFKPGKQYVIKISATNANNQVDYRMRVELQL